MEDLSLIDLWAEEDPEDTLDFFGRKVPPGPPILPKYNYNATRTHHGDIVYRKETHRFQCVQIELYYEDGYKLDSIRHKNSEVLKKLGIKYKEGTVVNGEYYEPHWD